MMKKNTYLLVFTTLLITLLSSFQKGEPKVHQGKLKVLDSIWLSDDSVLVDWSSALISYTPINKGMSLALYAYSERSISIYDNKGSLQYLYGKKQIPNGIQIKGYPNGFAMAQDTSYVLYSNFDVHVFYKDQYVKKISLDVHKKHTLVKGRSFEYIPSKKQFVLVQGKKYGSDKKLFSNNKLLTFFDAKSGKMLHQSASFPDAYQQYNKIYSFAGDYQYLYRQGDRLLVSYPNFPYVEQYDLDGKLIERSCMQDSPSRNKKILTNPNRRKNEKQISEIHYYRGPTAKAKDAPIYYHTFMVSKGIVLCRYDEATKEYLEVLVEDRLGRGLVTMLPDATKDHFYLMRSHMGGVMVYKVALEAS